MYLLHIFIIHRSFFLNQKYSPMRNLPLRYRKGILIYIITNNNQTVVNVNMGGGRKLTTADSCANQLIHSPAYQSAVWLDARPMLRLAAGWFVT